MKFFKILASIVVLLILLVVGIGSFIYVNLNSLVEKTVESEGSKLTQTAVELEGVDISLVDGRGEINGFTVANPPGFKRKNIFQFDQFVIQIDPASVKDDVLVIKEISIDGVTVIAEESKGRINFQELSKALSGDSKGDAATPETEEASSVRLMVEKLSFSEGQMKIITDRFEPQNVSLPSFNLINLGTREKGLSPQELGLTILNRLTRQTRKTAEREIKKLAKEEAREKTKEVIKKKADKHLKKLKEMF